MAITYRTTGDWGAGKGANLTPAEADGNMYDLDGRITTLETDPLTGVGIADITVTGDSFVVILTDTTELGPFTLPRATPSWKGEWVAGTTYPSMSLYYVPDDGLYMALQDHEAATDFDPDEETTDGPIQTKLMGLVQSKVTVVTEATTARTLALTDAGRYIRFDNAGATTATVAPEATVAFDVGTVLTLRAAGAGQVTVVAGAGVTINSPETLVLRKQGSTATLVKVGADTWDLSGDLVLV